MPLTPAITDKFTKVGNPGTATTLSAPGYTIADPTITVGSTTNWPTDTLVQFAIDRAQIVNGVEVRIAGTYNEFSGIVTSATTIGSLTKDYGTAQNYAAGSLTRVYIPVASTKMNKEVDGLNQDHNGKGNHKSLTDDNGNEFLERGSVASAVNQVKVTNAITATAPTVASAGDDTNIDLKVEAKGTGLVKVQGAVPQKFFAIYDFIESGCVWSGDAYGSTLNASMTAGVVWLAGKRLTVAAVTARAFTASKDTYVDFSDAGDGTAAINYDNSAANNAASPALTAGRLRAAIIVAGGANIANVGSINMGEEAKVLPIASSIPYAVTDSLGNLICPRDPNRKILGYRQAIANTTTGGASTDTQIVGLTVPVIIPTGRKVKITMDIPQTQHTSGVICTVQCRIWDGTVGAGTQLSQQQESHDSANILYNNFTVTAFTTPTSASKTYNGSIFCDNANETAVGSATAPMKIVVELA
jgi:hypothetical protein